MEQSCSGTTFLILILVIIIGFDGSYADTAVGSRPDNHSHADSSSSLLPRTEGLEALSDIQTIRSCLTDFSALENGGEKLWPVPPFAHNVSKASGNITFMLEQELPFCGLQTQEISLFRNGSSNPTVEGDRHGKGVGFLGNGYLKIGKGYFNTDEYCVSGLTTETVSIRYCEPDCSSSRPCVPKCFPPGEVMGFYPKRAPMPSGQVHYKPKFHDDNGLLPDMDSIRPHFVQMRPKTEVVCDSSTPLMILPFSDDIAARISALSRTEIRSMKFRVMIDGRLLYQVPDDHNCPEMRELKPRSYCVDGIQNVGSISAFNNTEEEGIIFTCALPSPGRIVSLLLGVGMLSSSLFLLLIIVVYGLLWQQQNIHGWTVVGHTTSMFFTYIFVGLAHIMRIKLVHLVGTVTCYVIGVLAHFFFLSTFFWLTLISFDLWWTFRSITPSKNNRGYRLLTYFLIGWGIPALAVFVAVCLDLAIGNECTTLRLPKYGRKMCFITESSQGLYVFYPVAATLMCNLVFFAITLYKLYHYRQRANAVSKKEQNNNKLLTLFSKLFFVMGITWVFEFLSWLHVGVWVTWFWAIFDIINILQALAIFIIYVCKQDILESLEKKYPRFTTWIRNTCLSWCLKKRDSNNDDSVMRTASCEGQDLLRPRDNKTKTSNCSADESQ